MLENPRPSKSIEGNRIQLRARARDQAAEMFALIEKNRQHLRPWMPWEPVTKEIDDSRAYLDMALRWWDETKTFDFSLYEKTSAQMIGSFGLHSLDWSKKSCEIGYWIDQAHQGKGYISEAVLMGEKIALELGFHRVVITCDRLNQRSQNIPRRLGYKLEAVQIDECQSGDRWRDTLRFVKLLNPEIKGQVTENLPRGFSIKECEAEEFKKLVDPYFEKIFDSNELILRPQAILSAEEKTKLKMLNENFQRPYLYHAVILQNDKLVGWTWGYQDSRESFYMVNSAILPDYRQRGLYTRLLQFTVDKLVEKGFQRIWSRHNLTNNSVIIAKMKNRFQITGSELNDMFGSLLHLTYYTNDLRKKILDFRSGHLRPDQELKDLFKI